MFAVIQDGQMKGMVEDPTKIMELPTYNMMAEKTEIIKVKDYGATPTSKLSVTSLVSGAFNKLKKVT